MPTADAFSSDTLFDGTVRLLQPKRGYRVNVDALLLAHFAARGRAPRSVLDLGAGVGAICLGLMRFSGARSFVLLESDPLLLELGAENLRRAGAQVHSHRLELGSDPLPEALTQRLDLVVCNPPFYDPTRHRPAQGERTRRARFGKLGPFLVAAARALAGPKSRADFAYPAGELTVLFEQAQAVGLVPKRLRLVHANGQTPARLALVELRRAKPGGLVVEPPLFEWQSPRRKSAELLAITSGTAADRT